MKQPKTTKTVAQKKTKNKTVQPKARKTDDQYNYYTEKKNK